MRDQHELAMKCLEVENSGGSVTEYLKSQGFISAKATWQRLQINELGRKYDTFKERFISEGSKKTVKKLTLEMKKHAVKMAIDGQDPRPYLARECGVRDTSTAWWKIRKDLKEADPAMFAKLPARLGRNGWTAHNDIFHNAPPAPKPDKGMPKTETPTVKMDGAIRIETPEANKVKVVETPEKMKITKPVNFGGYEVTAIRHPTLGEFYRDYKHDSIDWRSTGGDEVSLTPEMWIRLGLCLPDILGVLGVQI
ncbi:MAG: hypothetical protein IKG23_03220 [Clostridia bacterium]|nr:hypothetical protein [Clostridia bacterium]